MARLRYNGLNATLGGTGLTSSATSVTFGAALTHSNGTNVPTITGSDYIPLTILDAAGHLSEIVYLTAYTSGATTGMIARGKEGTTGVTHSSGDKVIHGPLVNDLVRGFARLRKSATQTVGSGTWTAVTWDTEDYDTLGWHDNATNNTRITVTADGLYECVATWCILTAASGAGIYSQFYVNGTAVPGRASHSSGTNVSAQLVRPLSLQAGDYVEAKFYAGNGASLGNLSDDACVFEVTRLGTL